MKVILIEQVDKLGTVGDTVDVKSGYARNFLLPNELALRATKENVDFFAAQKGELVKKAEAKKVEAKKIFDKIDNATVNVIRMSSDEGKLYGSVGTKDVAEALTKKYNNEFKKSTIILGNAIREVGIYPVKVRVHPEYTAVIIVCVGQNEAEIKKLIADSKKQEAEEVAVNVAESAEAQVNADKVTEEEAE